MGNSTLSSLFEPDATLTDSCPYGVLSSARQVLTFVFDKFFQGWNDLREVDTDSVPDDLGADHEIFMNDHVSDTFHFLPGNFRI